MPKSSTKRKNGARKKYVQRDAAGNPVGSRTKKHVRSIRYKQMIRMQILNSACESLTAAEVQLAINKGKGHEMSYISTKLDENGVPIEGETQKIKLSSIDVDRLKSIQKNKEASEKVMKKNAEKKE